MCCWTVNFQFTWTVRCQVAFLNSGGLPPHLIRSWRFSTSCTMQFCGVKFCRGTDNTSVWCHSFIESLRESLLGSGRQSIARWSLEVPPTQKLKFLVSAIYPNIHVDFLLFSCTIHSPEQWSLLTISGDNSDLFICKYLELSTLLQFVGQKYELSNVSSPWFVMAYISQRTSN